MVQLEISRAMMCLGALKAHYQTLRRKEKNAADGTNAAVLKQERRRSRITKVCASLCMPNLQIFRNGNIVILYNQFLLSIETESKT